jgi:hypothetical protein
MMPFYFIENPQSWITTGIRISKEERGERKKVSLLID